jgi:single-stranded DNA-specific DHH superfamily exonuclease
MNQSMLDFQVRASEHASWRRDLARLLLATDDIGAAEQATGLLLAQAELSKIVARLGETALSMLESKADSALPTVGVQQDVDAVVGDLMVVAAQLANDVGVLCTDACGRTLRDLKEQAEERRAAARQSASG